MDIPVPDTAIVLAGGLGTRLRTAVPDLPKPLAPIAGRPFLEYLLDYWIDQGITRFVLAVGYRAQMIRGHFGSAYRGCFIEYAEESRPLGTGGALLRAFRPAASDAPLLLLNGDTLFAVGLAELCAFHAENRSQWSLSLFRTRDNGRYMGMDIDRDGCIRSFGTTASSGERLANGGVYLFTPAVLAEIEATAREALSLETELFPRMLSTGVRFCGAEFGGGFIDIGVPEDYRRAADFLDGLSARNRI
jgi:D-glycero-alpha-D-manno-heptose 1-phosphate guanylyltransferase